MKALSILGSWGMLWHFADITTIDYQIVSQATLKTIGQSFFLVYHKIPPQDHNISLCK